MNFDAAAAYAERHTLHALFVQRDGETIFERYAPGYDRTTPHALYSGTKSFWGTLAVAAMEDGLLALDETVGETFAAWSTGERAAVTLRSLLTLTSGIGFGGLGNAVPTYENALGTALENVPGTTFTYGGVPLQVFGAVLAAKLRATKRRPHDYLRERVLAPIGCTIDAWRKLRDGTQPLPTGAFVSAQAWARFGRLQLERGCIDSRALVDPQAIATCFRGTDANPRYGLGWWLNPLLGDVAYASGSGGQAMYLSFAWRAVIVKFGRSASYAHETFLRRLFA